MRIFGSVNELERWDNQLALNMGKQSVGFRQRK